MVFQAKKEKSEKRRLEALAKKKEREDMLAAENADIAAKQSKANPVKVTQAEIAALQERERRENIAMGRKPSSKDSSLPWRILVIQLTIMPLS